MIIESIINWLLQVFQYAISLLPSNGTMFSTIPSLSYTSLKYISLLNGYLPIKEIGATFVIFLTVYASLLAISLIMWTYNNLSKLIP